MKLALGLLLLSLSTYIAAGEDEVKGARLEVSKELMFYPHCHITHYRHVVDDV